MVHKSFLSKWSVWGADWRLGLFSVLLVLGLLGVFYMMFSLWLAVLGASLGGLLWYVLSRYHQDGEGIAHRWYGWGCGVVLVIMLGAYWYPFYLSSAPLGFDTGLYRYEFLQSLGSLPQYSSNLFLGLPLITDVLSLFGVGVNGLMQGLYIGMFLLLAGVVFFVGRQKWGRDAAFFSLFFFAVSLVQWKMFEMVLFKQVLALSLVLYSLLMMSRRSLWCVLSLGFLVLLQPLDVFLVGVAFAVVVLLGWRDVELRNFSIKLVGIAGLALLLLAWLDPTFWGQAWGILLGGFRAVETLEYSLRSGVFLSLQEYGGMAMPILVFGLVGVVREFIRRGQDVFISYVLVVLVWILSGFFFYRRLLIQLDIMMILFAGVVVADALMMITKRWCRVVFVAGLVVFAGLFVRQVMNFRPLVAAGELKNIVSFCQQLDEGQYVMATDGRYGPWLRGYCPAQRVIAPGQFEYDLWSEKEWKGFWEDPYVDAEELISRFGDVVYVYIGQNQAFLDLPRNVFRKLGKGWWESEGTK